MRVLIYGFSGKILGGIETFILNMSEHMSSDTIFDYIIDGDTCVYRDRIEKRGGRIYFVPYIRKNPWKYMCTLKNILLEQKKINGTNVLYIQLFSMANMLPAIIGKMMCGYKVILHAHNNGLQNKSFLYEWIHHTGKFLTKKMGLIRFSNSHLSSDFMFGKEISSILIYNAIDRNRFTYNAKWRESVRKELNCGKRTVVGFVGRLARQKNPIFMLNVFYEYHKRNQNSELWIVGEGELKEEMTRYINLQHFLPYVKWLGRREDVEKVMCGMDLLLQPSLFEGLGIVLIEAQATGLPCISSEVVIPDEAKVTDNILFVNLKKDAIYWSERCRSVRFLNSQERLLASNKFPEYYNIAKEALRLELIITQ